LPWDADTIMASVHKTGRLVVSHEAPVNLPSLPPSFPPPFFLPSLLSSLPPFLLPGGHVLRIVAPPPLYENIIQL
jgi:hypothetical protein